MILDTLTSRQQTALSKHGVTTDEGVIALIDAGTLADVNGISASSAEAITAAYRNVSMTTEIVQPVRARWVVKGRSIRA